ncbi:MAG: hypothetical protein PHI37_01605 [Candidatus Gracilibacteria bacterium]|nr:hypothetical protein [Candidatus Gracilibacteria bacterium]
MKLFLNEKKTELFIKTSLWNSIIEVFLKGKNIDMSSYLVSIQIKNQTLLIKTNNPLINSELHLFYDKINSSFQDKIKNIDLKDYDFEIKFI